MLSLENCQLCPRTCGANRLSGDKGICGQNASIKLARAALHYWEEPPISGEQGSGTVFFSGCPLHCVYCQNQEIANGTIGKEVSVERLAQIFLELQEKGAHNINLVTPTHYVPQIIEALDMSRSKGLHLPIVYNTSGYEQVETIEALASYVDIFLTDFKYVSSEVAARYSSAPDYCDVALKALDAMYEVAGPYTLNEEAELLEHGIIIRHLLLPGQLEDSKAVMKLLSKRPYIQDVWVSIMSQYTPLDHIRNRYPELATSVSEQDYDELIDYAWELGIENSFCQEGEVASESFIPQFDYEGV